MKKRQRIAGYVLLAGGLWFIYQSLGLSLGPQGQPGPGFLGFFLGLGLAVCAAGLILHNRGPEEGASGLSPKPFWSEGAWKKPVFALGALILFILMMWLLGALVTMVLFFLVWLRGIEKTNWVLASLVAVIGTASFYLVFAVLLQISLPKGIFFS